VNKLPLLVLLAGALAGGCSWSSFDELADETWVDSVGGAEGVEPNDFIGVVSPGSTSPDNAAVFVALGRSTDSVGSYSYDVDGARASIGVDIRAGTTQFGTFPADVPIAGDPYSNNIAVASVTNEGGAGDTKVVSFEADNIEATVSLLDFQRTAENHPLDGSIMPTGLVFARTDVEHTGNTEVETDIVLARGAQLALLVSYEEPGDERAEFHACFGRSENDRVMTVGAGNFDAGDADDELVAVINDEAGTGVPQIIVFDGSAIAAAHVNETDPLAPCFGTSLAIVDGPAASASFGYRTVVGDFDGDGDPDIAISAPAEDLVTVYLWDDNPGDGLTSVTVDPPLDARGFGKGLAAGDLDGDGDDELVIGAPDSNSEGVENSGAAYVYNHADGDAFDMLLAVHDAEPETQQKFGVAVATVPWQGSQRILSVAADTEIFTYFRTALYDDVRQ